MKRISKHAAKKMALREVMEVVGPSTGMNVTVKMISEEYKIEWYRRRICSLAKNLFMEVIISKKGQTAIFYCRDFYYAELLRSLFKK